MEQLKNAIAARYSEVSNIALKVTKGNREDAQDLTQEVYLIMLEYDQSKLLQIVSNGHLLFWVTRVMMNQYQSSKASSFKKKHKPLPIDENAIISTLRAENINEVIEEDLEYYRKLDLINRSMEDLHFYDKTLFKVYYESDHTIRSLAQATGISTTSIFLTIKKVRNYIKDEVKNK